MWPLLLLSIILPVFTGCEGKTSSANAAIDNDSKENAPWYPTVRDIPLPEGYQRVKEPEKSFGHWLRQIRLKKDNQVYLFDGRLKKNQSAQFAVMDIPTGNKDLQQCADAVMRLRASWLYDQGRFGEISFADNNGKKYTAPSGMDSVRFERYLEMVYAYCGSLSLEKQLRKVAEYKNIKSGDVLIKGGSPGHAVIVVDVAENDKGHRLYLLAQSYMPAQNIHILKNPMAENELPWYDAEVDNFLIHTPEWTFSKKELRTW